MSGVRIDPQTIVATLRMQLPLLMAVHAFGSRAQGVEHADSDLDLAVLVEGHADPLQLWNLSGLLEDLAGCPVDLLDLRAASTVMQHQVLTTGTLWWVRDLEAKLWEAAVLSQKSDLDARRAGQLEDIRSSGSIHGR